MCSDGCGFVVPQQYRLIRHATHPMLPFGPSTQLQFFPPMPSLLCVGLVGTDDPQGTHQVLRSLCLWAAVTTTGLVSLTIVGSTP